MHERGLHVDPEQDTEPDQVDAELLCHRAQQRDDDERQFEKIKEEGEHENQDVDHDQETDLPARQVDQQVLNPVVTIDPVERERKNACSDQDEHHEGGQFGRAFHGLA